MERHAENHPRTVIIMLEQVDLKQKLSKTEYQSAMAELGRKAGALQRSAKELKIPVIIVFEGWDAAGKGTCINQLMQRLDPRGFQVHPISAPNTEEALRPFLWRFWTKMPENGRMAIFDRSWYGRVLAERMDKLVPKRVWSHAFTEIKSFERQLVDQDAVVIKFFLHISKKEQKKRFKKIEKIAAQAWKVTKLDWRHHKQYESYRVAVEEMLAATDSEYAPWTLVASHDRRFATALIFRTFIDSLANKIAAMQARKNVKSTPTLAAPSPIVTSVLDQVDLTATLTREKYDKKIKTLQNRIRDLEHEIFLQRLPVIIVFEGWDAAGKGGVIKRLTQQMDPRGFAVAPISAPNDVEKAHHYLWRFWMKMPKGGHICVFDRSWYGRVMVERVEGFCTTDEWKRAYREINEMEEQWCAFGAVLLKFWLHIDKDEQMRRFEERQKISYKQWKITDEDWRNREKWDQYKEAVDEMLSRTSTNHAPWTTVESNCKLHGRIKVLETVVTGIENKLA